MEQTWAHLKAAYTSFWGVIAQFFNDHYQEVQAIILPIVMIIAIVVLGAFAFHVMKTGHPRVGLRRWRRIKRMREKTRGELERSVIADAVTDALDKLHLDGALTYRRKMYWFHRLGNMAGLADLVPRTKIWLRKEHPQAVRHRLDKLKAVLKEKHPDHKPKEKPTNKLSLVRRRNAA